MNKSYHKYIDTKLRVMPVKNLKNKILAGMIKHTPQSNPKQEYKSEILTFYIIYIYIYIYTHTYIYFHSLIVFVNLL